MDCRGAQKERYCTLWLFQLVGKIRLWWIPPLLIAFGPSMALGDNLIRLKMGSDV